jgi:cytochrome b
MSATSEGAGRGEGTPAAQVPVWDILVRVGHWLLVVLFFVAYFTEDDLLSLHSWAGYGVAAYVVLRIVWGFVGSQHARFADFAYGPLSAARYLWDLLTFRAKRHLGHSPAGAMMVFALLFCLAVTTASGIALLAVEENAGPLAPWLGPEASLDGDGPALLAVSPAALASDDEDEGGEGRRGGEDALGEIHEVFANLTLILVVLHIAGVGLASVVHRESLVRAMITGRKRAQ